MKKIISNALTTNLLMTSKSFPLDVTSIDLFKITPDTLIKGIPALKLPIVFDGLTFDTIHTEYFIDFKKIPSSNPPPTLSTLTLSVKQQDLGLPSKTYRILDISIEFVFLILVCFDTDRVTIDYVSVGEMFRKKNVHTQLFLNLLEALNLNQHPDLTLAGNSMHIGNALFFNPLHKYLLDGNEIPRDFVPSQDINISKFSRRPASYSSQAFVNQIILKKTKAPAKTVLIRPDGSFYPLIKMEQNLGIFLKQHNLKKRLDHHLN